MTEELDPWPIRTRDGAVEVATNVYRHELSGRSVSLTGMLHMGERVFYETLREEMCKAEADGTEIQYELVREPTQSEVNALDPGPRLALHIHKLHAGTILTETADMAGLVTQHVLDPPESWVNTDVTSATIMRLLGATALPRAKKVRRLANWLTRRKRTRRLVGWAARGLVTHFFPDAEVMERAGRRDLEERKVIVEHRNDAALTAILGTDRPVHALWGAGHVPGIHDGLVAADFELVDQTWRTAIAGKR